MLRNEKIITIDNKDDDLQMGEQRALRFLAPRLEKVLAEEIFGSPRFGPAPMLEWSPLARPTAHVPRPSDN